MFATRENVKQLAEISLAATGLGTTIQCRSKMKREAVAMAILEKKINWRGLLPGSCTYDSLIYVVYAFGDSKVLLKMCARRCWSPYECLLSCSHSFKEHYPHSGVTFS